MSNNTSKTTTNSNFISKSVTIDFDDLLRDRECECGKLHTCGIKKIVMRRGALEELPTVIKSLGNYSRVALVCDENTYAAAGKRVSELYAFSAVAILPPENLHANEHGVALCEAALPSDIELLVAVGSGTIHDITRYTAYMRGIKFVSVPTAASVDGFVSNVAAMTLRGAKKTIPAGTPIAMVADTEIIAASPMRLTASGFGDMIGKYTALLDWRISNLFTGEDICDFIIGLVEEALVKVKESAFRLALRDPDAYESLIYGLVLSGIAMQLTGSSRPASGAEHHISHFIEMTVPNEICSALHGEKVGVGERAVIEFYHSLASMSDDEISSLLSSKPRMTEEYISKFFGALTPEILNENANNCTAGITNTDIISKLPQIRALISKYLPKLSEIDTLYDTVGACKSFSDIGLEESFKTTAISAAPLVRNRVTLLRLFKI